MFNVGDRVKILKNCLSNSLIGSNGTIKENCGRNEPGTTDYFFVILEDGESYYFDETEMELMESTGIQVKIKRLSPDSVVPTYATAGSACFDLVASEDVLIQPGETKAIPTGLSFEIPEGYQMKIHPRSGISLKTPLRIANAPGCVDSDYRGEVKVLLWNTLVDQNEDCNWYTEINGCESRGLSYELPLGTYGIRKGDRIAQAEIVPVLRASFVLTDELTETERGDGAFGSTGLN